MNGRTPQPRLTVWFEGRRAAILRPDSSWFTFGRDPDRTLRLDDPSVSRRAGSIGWVDGVWMIYNDSATRPFDVVVDGVPHPVHPRTSGDARCMWALGPHPAKIHLAAGRERLYEIGLEPHSPVPPRPRREDGQEPSLPVVREPTTHERLVLAARFLSLPEPGEALQSNAEAAQYANATLPPDERTVGKAAVANVVYRWRIILENLGVQNLHDDSSLGRQLLAWGVIRQEDRQLLRSWRP